jgi:hypothetical protein
MIPARSDVSVATVAGWIIAILSSIVSLLMIAQFNSMNARLLSIETSVQKIEAMDVSIRFIKEATTTNTADVKRLQETKADK